MQTLGEIRELLEAHGLTPRKRFGQNFLVDHNLLRRLVESSGVGRGDVVLEVGPGTGTLTEELLGRGCRVVASEVDRGLVGLLRDRFAEALESGALVLVEGDCLESKRRLSRGLVEAIGEGVSSGISVEGRVEGEFRLVANLPYGCATPLMLTLLAEHAGCTGMFVTVQREVADRLLAGPGSRDYGPLGVVAQLAAEPRRLATLGPACFWPRPGVESAMVAVTRRASPLVGDVRGFAEFCTMAFGRRRKQLGSVLGDRERWPEGVTRETRVEALGPAQLVALWELHEGGSREQPGARD